MSDKLSQISEDPSRITRFANRTDDMVQLAISKDPTLLGKLANTKKGVTPAQFGWAVANTASLLSPSSGAFESRFFGLQDNNNPGFNWNLVLTNEFLEAFQSIRPIECRRRWVFGSNSDLVVPSPKIGAHFGIAAKSLPEVILDGIVPLPEGYLETLLSMPELAQFIRQHPDYPKSKAPLDAIRSVNWRDLPLTPATRLFLAVDALRWSQSADSADVSEFRKLIDDFRASDSQPFIAPGLHNIECLLGVDPAVGVEFIDALIDKGCLPEHHGKYFAKAFNGLSDAQKNRFFSLAGELNSAQTIVQTLHSVRKSSHDKDDLAWLSPEVVKILSATCEREGMLDSLVYHLPSTLMDASFGIQTFRKDCATLNDLPAAVLSQLTESDLCDAEGLLVCAISRLSPSEYEPLIARDTGPLRTRLAREGGLRNSGSRTNDKEVQLLIDVGLGPQDILEFAAAGRQEGRPLRLTNSSPAKELVLGLSNEEMGALVDAGTDLRVDASLLKQLPKEFTLQFIRAGAWESGIDDEQGTGPEHVLAFFDFIASGKAVSEGAYRHQLHCSLSPSAFNRALLEQHRQIQLPPSSLTIRWQGDSLRSLQNAVTPSEVEEFAAEFGLSDLWPPSVFRSRPYLESTLKGLARTQTDIFHNAIRLISRTKDSSILRQIQDENEALLLDAIGEPIANGDIPAQACGTLDADRIAAGWRARRLALRAATTPTTPQQSRSHRL